MAEEIEKYEQRYFKIFESATIGMIILNTSWCCEEVNPAACEMLGFTQQEITGIALIELFPPEDSEEIQRSLTLTAELGKTETTRYMRRKDGIKIWIDLTALNVISDAKSFYLLLIRDMSERLKLEQQLIEAQRMEAVGRLAGGVAHDFNNLLQGILGYAQLALHETTESELTNSYLLEIQTAAMRAAYLTSQLLAFSRKQILRMVVLNLNTVVKNCPKILRHLIGEDIELKIAIEENLSSVRADPTQIEQILINLAVNSRDAMPDGGKLEITTSNIMLDTSFCDLREWAQPGTFSLIEVTDTGMGIKKENFKHIFEPFYTTREVGKGTGLGLSTVYGIMKQHNGLINVTSKEGQGTSVFLYFPVCVTRPKEEEQKPTPTIKGGDETILIAEDEEIVRSLITRILTDYGYTPIVTTNGKEASKTFREQQSNIDMVLLDIVMPEMNGHQVYDAMKRINPNLKALFMTGYILSDETPHVTVRKDDKIILKPFSPEQLARRIRETLDNED